MRRLLHRPWLLAVKTYLRTAVRKRPGRPLEELEPDRVRRVLILNATALGDLLFSTPALRALRETYPAWEQELLVTPALAPLLAHHPGVTRLWAYPGRGLGLLRLMRELREQAYDLAVILHGNDPEATLLAHGSGSPWLIGSAKSPLAFAYAARVAHPDPFEHAVERRLDYVRLLGADTADTSMEIFLPRAERERARDILATHFGAAPEMLLALHPSGSAPYKRWPLENFAELGRHLQEHYGAALLIISGVQDRTVAEALAARLPGPALVTGGRHSLTTTAALLSSCRLFVGNDSGPLHLALALQVPTLALMGADHPRRVGPYRVDWGDFLYRKEEVCDTEPCRTRRCRDNLCLQAITVRDVTTRLEAWWLQRRP
ncbi:MAG: glycosyltransferase family 9 protein [Deltaproteobacteria bacterium]|nr:glycosyltransferase family 9 protein [Deltaproteobacteria bacterium]